MKIILKNLSFGLLRQFNHVYSVWMTYLKNGVDVFVMLGLTQVILVM